MLNFRLGSCGQLTTTLADLQHCWCEMPAVMSVQQHRHKTELVLQGYARTNDWAAGQGWGNQFQVNRERMCLLFGVEALK